MRNTPPRSRRLPELLQCSALLWLSLLCAAAHAATPTPRATVDEVAEAIQSRYYDIQRAGEIARSLRSEADQGRYDRYQDPRDLATALSTRIQPHDGHFRVNWRAPQANAASTDGALVAGVPNTAAQPRVPDTAAPPPTDFSRRRNYGLRRIEVLPGNLGYMDLREFPELRFGDPDDPARRALDAALQLLSATDAVIIDLRDNGGGSTAAVGYLTSAFTPKHADIYSTFHWRRGHEVLTETEAPKDWYATPRLQVPLYLLTSARTGSAAEALAYTLKNARRGSVVGETSAGAANPGDEIPLSAGFSVFVSTGSPISPITHRNWEGSGVTPDVEVASAQALDTARRLALEAALEQGLSDAAATDARWALEALRAQAAAGSDTAAATEPADYLGQYERMQVGRDGAQWFLRNGKRPAQPLAALQRDLFYLAADPSVRVRFERDGVGRVAALEVLRSDGSSSRFRSQAAP